MDLQVHLGLRFIKWTGNYSYPTAPNASVLAGSRFSRTYGRIYLYSFLESLHYNFPIVLGVHVDDLATQFHGELEEIVSTVRAAAVFIRDSFLARKQEDHHRSVQTQNRQQDQGRSRQDWNSMPERPCGQGPWDGQRRWLEAKHKGDEGQAPQDRQEDGQVARPQEPGQEGQ